MKSTLAKDSVLYGGSTIIAKMMSWLLTVLFTRTLTEAEFGMMTNLYAWVAVIIVILTFGMETGLFRFINQTDKYRADTVYSTVLATVGLFAAVFLCLFMVFLKDIRPWLWDERIPDSIIRLVIIILSIDAFSAIPFAYLRYKKRPLKFGLLRVLNIGVYTLTCIFLLVVCPEIERRSPGALSCFWHSDRMLFYVFVANLTGTLAQTLLLLPELTGFSFSFDRRLAVKMLRYCFPLVIMGLAGMSNQVVDKIVFPTVYPDPATSLTELGLYSGCFKIALVMMMFTQAFRYAYEPFVFEKSRERDSRRAYADVMKYFIMLGLAVFLVVMLYLDFFKYFVKSTYWSALPVVPVVLAGELFFAVYFNLSIWYKLTDRTYWGTIFSVVGFVVIIALNVIFIPAFGYMACAWAAFAANLLMMLLSYFVGQRYYPIRYDFRTIALYTALAAVLYSVSIFVPINNFYQKMTLNTILIAIYMFVLVRRDLPVNEIPYLNRILKR